VDDARYTRIIHCRLCCNLYISHTASTIYIQQSITLSKTKRGKNDHKISRCNQMCITLYSNKHCGKNSNKNSSECITSC